MVKTQTLSITLTKEQALQVLAATGLMVNSLELPPGAADGDEAVARIPIPDWLKDVVTTDGEEVNENG